MKNKSFQKHIITCHKSTLNKMPMESVVATAGATFREPLENRTCPFCSEITGGKPSKFVKHVARHMEEIGLTALPQDAETDSEPDSDVNSTRSGSVSEAVISIKSQHNATLNTPKKSETPAPEVKEISTPDVEDDIGVTATMAAGLERSEFDPTYRQQDSALWLGGTGFYNHPPCKTVTDVAFDLPQTISPNYEKFQPNKPNQSIDMPLSPQEEYTAEFNSYNNQLFNIKQELIKDDFPDSSSAIGAFDQQSPNPTIQMPTMEPPNVAAMRKAERTRRVAQVEPEPRGRAAVEAQRQLERHRVHCADEIAPLDANLDHLPAQLRHQSGIQIVNRGGDTTPNIRDDAIGHTPLPEAQQQQQQMGHMEVRGSGKISVFDDHTAAQPWVGPSESIDLQQPLKSVHDLKATPALRLPLDEISLTSLPPKNADEENIVIKSSSQDHSVRHTNYSSELERVSNEKGPQSHREDVLLRDTLRQANSERLLMRSMSPAGTISREKSPFQPNSRFAIEDISYADSSIPYSKSAAHILEETKAKTSASETGPISTSRTRYVCEDNECNCSKTFRTYLALG